MKKSVWISAVLIFLTVLCMGCGKQTKSVAGAELFGIGDAKSLTVQIGGKEEKITDADKIAELKRLLGGIKMQKTELTDKEGGIIFTFDGESQKSITVCGDQILYDGTAYQTDKDISDSLMSIIRVKY